MTGEANLARFGSLLADGTRATILLTLLNGGLTSALAERANVSRSLASAHRRKLVAGGSIGVEPRGRRRRGPSYFGAGLLAFAELGIDVAALAARPRLLTRACLAWSECRTEQLWLGENHATARGNPHDEPAVVVLARNRQEGIVVKLPSLHGEEPS